MSLARKSERPNSRRRLLACLLALPLGVVLADLGYGKFWVDAGKYEGPPLPPFDIVSNPVLMQWVEAQRALPPRSVKNQTCGVYDQQLGWTNRQGETLAGGRQVTINSIGARATCEFDAEPRADSLRLACFGDSFTFCSEVDDEDTWCAQLEAKEPRLEVVNLGVAGYGLDQALLRYRALRVEVQPDVVVIGLQVDGVGRNVNRCRPLLATRSRQVFVKPRFRLEGSELELVPLPFGNRRDFLDSAARGRLLEDLSESEFWGVEEPLIPGSTLLRLQAASRAAERRHRRTIWGDRQGEAFSLALALLDTFRSEALEDGAREVALILFPDRQDRQTRIESGSAYLDPLREALRERRWSWIDLDVLLVDELDDPRKLFVTTHFNREGNGRVADALHSWLLDRPDLLD